MRPEEDTILRTDRLVLRPVGDEDVDRILEYRNLPEVTRWLLRTEVDAESLRAAWRGAAENPDDHSKAGHRYPDALPLPAGQLPDRAVDQLGGAGRVQRAGHGVVVPVGPAAEPALVRVAPAGDQVGHRDAVRRDRALREQAEHLGDIQCAAW